MPSCANPITWNGRYGKPGGGMDVGGPEYANGTNEPSVVFTAPMAMRPSQPDPTAHCWKPPSTIRVWPVSVASARTSPSTTGCHVGM